MIMLILLLTFLTVQNSECNFADCNITDTNLKVKLKPLAKKSIQNKSIDLRISVKEIKPFSVSGISNGNFLFDTTPLSARGFYLCIIK